MQCYTELTPPTAVTHSLTLPFIAADAKNLILAKTSLLQIFTYKTISSSSKSSHQRAGDTKLVLVSEYALSGTITSLVGIRIPASKSGGKALLVGLKDARLSLIEWDPERHGPTTISIHYYEQDELQGSPWAPDIGNCVNYLTVDPNGRCAALRFGVRNLAVLPFSQKDDDIDMNDGFDEDQAPKLANGNHLEDSPHGTSFVVQLSKLDSTIIHPIHLAFLYAYRQNATFGILSSSSSPTSSLLHERKDHIKYMVFTLDPQTKEYIPILSISGLPYDLFKVIPLPSPIEGALLVGGNEIIHVNQAGKAIGVGVNLFAKHSTSFGLIDQSELALRLEGCIIEQLSIENGEMLIILHTGALAILSFHMDGSNVSSLSIRKVADELGGSILAAGPASASALGGNAMFLGSENSNSVILGWSKKSTQSSRRKSQFETPGGLDEMMVDDEEEEEEEDLDDDLYGDSSATLQTTTNGGNRLNSANSKPGDYVFRIHDSLINIAPMSDVTLGKPAAPLIKGERLISEDVRSDLQLVAATGSGKASSLAVFHQNIQQKVIGRFDLPDVQGIWTIHASKPVPSGAQANQETMTTREDHSIRPPYDNLMIVSRKTQSGAEESDVFALTPTGFEALTEIEFDCDAGATIEAGTLGRGARVIQVLQSVVRIYDGNLGLAQILDMSDDDTGAEPKIISASLADPYLLLIRDDSSIYVAQCDDNNEVEELEREDDKLLSMKWLTGCLYADATSIFTNHQNDKGQNLGQNVVMFLLSVTGTLHVYSLPDLSKPIYVTEGLPFVPPILSANYVARRTAARETIAEILVADLGDKISKFPYLILRGSNDDLTIYEPFRTSSSSTASLTSTLHFSKMPNPHIAQDPIVSASQTTGDGDSVRNNPMRFISNLGGYSTVFLPGGSPAFVIKSSKSTPKVIGLQGSGVRNMSNFHTEECDRGFIYTDVHGIARVAQLPSVFSYDLGMAVRKIELGQAIHGVAYHPPTQVYAIGTSAFVDFELPKGDDGSKKHKEELPFKPTTEKSFVQLISPVTWEVIDTFELDPYEIIMCIKTLNLEISETTNERRQMITIGTALTKGEDVAIKGRIYVFDVIEVVPQPGYPETNRKLKLYAKEEIPRGAVTGLAEVGTQGFMLVAQGQKCMVRGVKEDGTVLPVAFQDVNCYVTSIKALRGTGIVLMGDALKGVWLTGYAEDPYRLVQLGKMGKNIEVLAVDLLPDGKDLFIVVADANGNLHVLQYDPEHPKSLQGHLLLQRTTFSLGSHLPTSMVLLPRTTTPTNLPPAPNAAADAADATIPSSQILISSTTGSLALLSTLSETQYRKFNTLTTTLSNSLHHACGLNPRAYRIGKDPPEAMVGGRNVVDGTMLMRWAELGSQKRAEVAGRVGVDVEEVREDLRVLRGGLGYL